jgi:hypothetical protein
MMTDESRLPKTVAGLFGTAGALFVRRAPLYAALAAIAIVVQYVVDVLLPHSDGLITGLGIIVDAFFVAAVSIGVAFDLAGKAADWSTVLLAASERWGVVSVVAFVNFLVFDALAGNVFGSPADTLYGFLVLPIVVFWGAVSLGQVVAAIEPVKTQLSLPFLALGKAMSVSLRLVNLGRLALLSLIIVLPTVVNVALATALRQHHVPDADFWGGVPVDAITLGPIQALSTVFYIDFLRRARP